MPAYPTASPRSSGWTTLRLAATWIRWRCSAEDQTGGGGGVTHQARHEKWLTQNLYQVVLNDDEPHLANVPEHEDPGATSGASPVGSDTG